MQSYISRIADTSMRCGCATSFSVKPECAKIHQDLRALDRDGYVVLRNVFSAEQCQLAVESLEYIHANTDPDDLSPVNGHACQYVDALLYRDLDTFFQFTLNPRLVSLLSHASEAKGVSFHLASLTSRSALSGCADQALHEDYHVDVVPFAFNAVIMLNDFTEVNGATRLVVGSHRHMLFVGLEGHREEVMITGSAGDVLLFNAAIVHGGTSNRTGNTRHALMAFYCSRDRIQFNACRHLMPGSHERIAALALEATEDSVHPDVSLINHEEIDSNKEQHASQADCKHIIFNSRELFERT
ncbi:hypothetical protein BGX28_007598 [Mortierella sp. GBA30]|nr:hypothetical protein BGX28_007598 [Mortierella sp. GBA30]